MQSTHWLRRAGWATVPVLMLFLAAAPLARQSAAAPPGDSKAAPHDPTAPPRLPGAHPTHGAIVPHGVRPSDYWLGIECYPVPAPLQAQLNLPEQQGLLVESVVPDSPAAKAGIKPFDILMKVGDKPLKAPGELIEAVEAAKDKEVSLEVLRGGKPQKIKAKPVRRPEGEAAMPHEPHAGEADWATLRKWLEQTRQQLERHVITPEMPALRFRFLHPGAILPPVAPLPPNTTVSVTKKGNEPAKITVTRDNEKWEVTENELGKLPPDLRPHVEQMLGRVAFGVQGRVGEPRRPEAERPPRDAPPEQPGAERRMERQMDLINRRIEQLQNTVNEMRERLPRMMEERIERMQKSVEEMRERARDRERDKAPPKPREEKKRSEGRGI